MKPITFLTDLQTRFQIVVLLLLTITLAPHYLSAQTVKEENYTRAMAEFIDGIIHFENGDIEEALDKLTAAYLMHSSDPDRKSTRLNSSHVAISYAVCCSKKNNRRTIT